MRAGHVRVNDAPIKASFKVVPGDIIRIRDHGFDKIVEPYSKLARDRGNTIAIISKDELARWEKATAGVDEIWLKDVAAKGGDGKKLIDEAKALLQKYAPK